MKIEIELDEVDLDVVCEYLQNKRRSRGGPRFYEGGVGRRDEQIISDSIDRFADAVISGRDQARGRR